MKRLSQYINEGLLDDLDDELDTDDLLITPIMDLAAKRGAYADRAVAQLKELADKKLQKLTYPSEDQSETWRCIPKYVKKYGQILMIYRDNPNHNGNGKKFVLFYVKDKTHLDKITIDTEEPLPGGIYFNPNNYPGHFAWLTDKYSTLYYGDEKLIKNIYDEAYIRAIKHTSIR